MTGASCLTMIRSQSHKLVHFHGSNEGPGTRHQK